MNSNFLRVNLFLMVFCLFNLANANVCPSAETALDNILGLDQSLPFLFREDRIALDKNNTDPSKIYDRTLTQKKSIDDFQRLWNVSILNDVVFISDYTIVNKELELLKEFPREEGRTVCLYRFQKTEKASPHHYKRAWPAPKNKLYAEIAISIFTPLDSDRND